VLRPISPPSLPPPAAAYSHAILVESPQRLLYTAGAVPVAADGTVPADVAEQAAQVWANLGAILTEAGMTVTDVVSMITYVVVGSDVRVVMAARDAAMAGHRPASTLVLVPALAQPAWRVEVSLVAAT
jgi:enamine deaminase RidA (YjgF/YER057c/UK114 family)